MFIVLSYFFTLVCSETNVDHRTDSSAVFDLRERIVQKKSVDVQISINNERAIQNEKEKIGSYLQDQRDYHDMAQRLQSL